MSPELGKAARAGVIALVIAVALAVGAWWFADDGGVSEEALVAAESKAQTLGGKEPLRERVSRQRQANLRLADDITALKSQLGFKLRQEFTVPPGQTQAGRLFNERFLEVRDRLRQQAQNKRIELVEDLGFKDYGNLPDHDIADRLLKMLQLTEKAVGIAIAAPDPIEWFQISHSEPVKTGPAGRPPLLVEYPLRLKVRGSLKSILWIQHRLSLVEDPDKDYPLILRGLSITSDNTKMTQNVQQLVAEFDLAGIEFVSDAERGVAAARPAEGSSGAGRAAARP